jgi:hypothetical protein
LDVRINEPEFIGVVMAHHYSKFVTGAGEITPSQATLAGAMIGLLFNTIDYTRILYHNNELGGHCAKAGFRPIFRILQSEEDVHELAAGHHIEFLGRFRTVATSFLTDHAQQLVMLGLILLTIGKNIQVEGYIRWITKRVRAFMGTLGLENTNIIWVDACYPSIAAMNSIATYLSASFFLRREVFRVCWAVSSGQHRFANLFKDVVGLLKGTNMTHVVLIDEYLYTRYRELLSIRLLASNHKGIMAAWEFLASLPPHETYLCKILYGKETTACFNRNNFARTIPDRCIHDYSHHLSVCCFFYKIDLVRGYNLIPVHTSYSKYQLLQLLQQPAGIRHL